MSHVQIIPAGRYRHFMPVAPDLTLSIPGFIQTPNANGAMTLSETFTHVATADGLAILQLPMNKRADVLANISIKLNGVAYPNTLELVTNGFSFFWVPGAYSYDMTLNQIAFKTNAGIGAAIPVAGTQIEVQIINIRTDNAFNRINIPQPYRVQGANPPDPALVQLVDTGNTQFQGGYLCLPEIVAVGNHGASIISPDRLDLWYRPDMGYKGVDSFSYRLVSSLGQQSNAACVTITVG